MTAANLVELWRGDLLESVHAGHIVVAGPDGAIEHAWGDPDAIVFPRSSAKMIQALPLVESGAAEGLATDRLALACASHRGAHIHTDRVEAWLADLGLSESDLRCGSHMPGDRDAAHELIREGHTPCQIHNNCSGKHTGFLMMTEHLRAGPEYVEVDHPVQQAVRQATEDLTGGAVAGWGVDGCSAPNFAGRLSGFARAMAAYANAGDDTRGRAQRRLTEAMMAHPELVAGVGRADTRLMQAAPGRVAVKGGAEGFAVAIIPGERPGQGRGVALKIVDGAGRAAEAAIAAVLVRLGVLDADDPAVADIAHGVQTNWRGRVTGRMVTRL